MAEAGRGDAVLQSVCQAVAGDPVPRSANPARVSVLSSKPPCEWKGERERLGLLSVEAANLEERLVSRVFNLTAGVLQLRWAGRGHREVAAEPVGRVPGDQLLLARLHVGC